MSGDYSRHRFDARNNYVGVWMQQGRVQLDADWNEWAQLLERRSRAAALDSIPHPPPPGIAGVAMVSPQTPDAFKIEAAGGQISIGRGRMVVDGLLAENHGGGSAEYDTVLNELRGADPLDYTAQPYFKDPPPLPDGGPHLAYLETWQREVTWLEHPELVEKALSVDTTTRMQSVWQVRLLADVGSVDCQTPDAQIQGWSELIGPSAGRLSSRAVGVAPDLDPCELPPTGGYRGLENQLYRVEVHDGGPLGQATFKWSRDNASVGARVREIVSTTELELDSLGRDAVLRFNTGDWVEIVDDWWELSGEGNDPALRRGVMRKITVDDATRTISFTPALPAGLVPGGGSADDTLESRHLRVRRFDQKGTVRDDAGNIVSELDPVASNGVITIPPAGTWVVLEHGVQVDFDLVAGGQFNSGDYWVFAARTADASLESLEQAPPLGVHRHYTRLALVTFPNAETDCRPHPASCGGCCTVNVSPGENIQAAIDSLPIEGGCVCLKSGVHDIPAAIEIRASRILLKGESPGSIVRGDGLPVMLQIGAQGSIISDIVVEGLRFESPRPGEGMVFVFISDCARVRVEHCELVYTGAQISYHIGVFADDVWDLTLAENRIVDVYLGIWVTEYASSLHIEGNLMRGLTYDLAAQDDIPLGEYGIQVDSDTNTPARIEHNRLRDFWVGIAARDGAHGSLVAHNRIARSGSSVQQPLPDSPDALRQHLDGRHYAIDIEAARCTVHSNQMDLTSNVWGGIRVRGEDCVVSGNLLETDSSGPPMVVATGIYCTVAASQKRAADRAQVSGNRLLGATTGIVMSRIHGATVMDNHVDGHDGGWYGVYLDACDDSCVRGNVVRNAVFAIHAGEGARNHIIDNGVIGAGIGISGNLDERLDASGNSTHDCVVAGVALLARHGASLHGNQVSHCGYSGLSIGIAALSDDILMPAGAVVQIQDCTICDTGISAQAGQVTQGAAIGIGGWVSAVQVTGNRIGYAGTPALDVSREHRALLLMGPIGLRLEREPSPNGRVSSSALISGNTLRGPGASALVELLRLSINDNFDFRFEKVSFSNNVCEHLDGVRSDLAATVRLAGAHLIAMGNHVAASPEVFSMSLANRPQVALMGNVTTGGYIQVGTVKPTPISDFNVQI